MRSLIKSFVPLIFATSKRFCSSEACIPLRNRKPKSVRSTTLRHYVDSISIRTTGGNGGDGCVSLSSDFHSIFAGPDGGDGGSGGHVIFLSTESVKNLNHCKRIEEAQHGEKGYNKDCTGKNGEHKIVNVPIGTIIRNVSGQVVADLDKEGKMFIASRGGAGGKGNKFFTTDVEQAPRIAEYGAKGELNVYTLEVKSMAHIGLLGFPNAGKSTLLQAISRARPRVAPYEFTTLYPHLGIVQYADYEQIAVADLPGIIAGSHENRGLGIKFLQHIERCCCLAYVIDLSVSNPREQYDTLKFELSQFSAELATKPQLIIANKMDLVEAQENLPKFEKHCKEFDIFPISAKMGSNLLSLLKKIRQIYNEQDQHLKIKY